MRKRTVKGWVRKLSEQLQSEFKEVKISDIIIDEANQIRLDVFAGVDELAADIKENGLINPIELRVDTDGNHLVAGRRRLEACKKLKWEKIPAKLVTISVKDAIIHTTSENLNSQTLSPKEIALALKAEINAGWKEYELPSKHGKKKEWIREHLALLELPERIQTYVHEKKLPISTANKIAEEMKDISADKKINVARTIVYNRYTVRNSEELINQEVQEHEERQQFGEAVQKSKFKTCPTCHKKAADFGNVYYIQTNRKAYVRCITSATLYNDNERSLHTWNLKTGQTLSAERQSEQRLERIKQIKEGGGAKAEKPKPTQAFRSDVPVSVINEALLEKAVDLIITQLRKHPPKKTIEITIDGGSDTYSMSRRPNGFRAAIREFTENSLSVELPQPFGMHLFESYKYTDGNLTKVTPQQYGTASTERAIHERNEKVRKALDSLPKIAKYHKSHKNQRKL